MGGVADDMAEPPRSRTILVVMDDEDLSEIVRDVLRAEGYEVVHGSRGEEALERVKARGVRPALVLLDSWKPGMPGRFLHLLRQEPGFGDVPVVLCTTYKRFALPGVQGTLRMPFDLDELLLTVGEHVR